MIVDTRMLDKRENWQLYLPTWCIHDTHTQSFWSQRIIIQVTKCLTFTIHTHTQFLITLRILTQA